MFDRFLPARADNTYRAHKVALWIFGAVVAFKSLIAFGTIFNGYTAASSADGIPLASFSPAAVQTVLSDFAIWGVAMLTICFIAAVVLMRYRSLVPFMFSVIFAEHVLRKVALYFIPVVTSGSHPGSIMNIVLLALLAIGLVLSLVNREPFTSSAAA